MIGTWKEHEEDSDSSGLEESLLAEVDAAVEAGESDHEPGDGSEGEQDEAPAENEEEVEEDDDLQTRKRRRLVSTAEPLRKQVASRATANRGREALGKLVGEILYIHQAVGGLSCTDCNTTICKGWEVKYVKIRDFEEDEPVPYCRPCSRSRRDSNRKRSANEIKTTELRKKVKMLWPSHSSWGSMDLLKADTSMVSSMHPLAREPEHLTCTPLPLEQAVCLSTRWKTKEFSRAERPGLGPSQCIHEPDSPFIRSQHTRNIVELLRRALLDGAWQDASRLLAALLSERRNVPDVIFKAGMQVLRKSPLQDHSRQCRRFVSALIGTSVQPRTKQMVTELARFYMQCGSL